MLLASETSHFCCQFGRHVVDFAQYFQSPDETLQKLFRGDSDSADANLSTSFSALSRKYNSLFALAQHEIQSNTLEREIKLQTPYAPANIRIHGTMYRKVHSAFSQTPLRYLIFDPKARETVATQQHLKIPTVKALEKELLLHNPYMTSLRRLGTLRTAAVSPAVVLQWHEGVQEVAAIIDETPAPDAKPRAVYLYLKDDAAPQYHHALSCMYESLS